MNILVFFLSSDTIKVFLCDIFLFSQISSYICLLQTISCWRDRSDRNCLFRSLSLTHSLTLSPKVVRISVISTIFLAHFIVKMVAN